MVKVVVAIIKQNRIWVSGLLVLLCLLAAAASSAEDTTHIRVTSRGDDNAAYAVSMIRLALQKVGKPFKLDVESDDMSAPKLREEVKDGKIDIIWTSTSMEMEQVAIPVRIPLFKGLLGYRVLLVHKQNQNLFDAVMTLEQARNYRYGQGLGWADTAILQANGLNVITSAQYEGLFHMTDGKRFDAFPSGGQLDQHAIFADASGFVEFD